jgi:16S rRNA (cytidine1402-2'-O)-methyltransferase
MTGPDPLGAHLVLVATPIGNLGDLSPRALDVLVSADLVYCEDTRRTRVLFSAAGVPARPARLRSLHRDNEGQRVGEVLAALARGALVAVVSDAGTPGISDPGAHLASAVAAQGWPVTVVPGPSAVLAALVVSGLPTERFCVEGFLPRKGVDRRERLSAIAEEERTTVILEAPGRVATTLAELHEVCGPRPIAVARELTKVHETVWRGSLDDAVRAFGEDEVRGEVVLVLGGATRAAITDAELDAAVAARLRAGLGVRAASDEVATDLGIPRRRAYRAALALDAERRSAKEGR